MTVPNSAIIIFVVMVFALYLIYNQNNQPMFMQHMGMHQQHMGGMNGMNVQQAPQAPQCPPCPPCNHRMPPNHAPSQGMQMPPQPINVNIAGEDTDPYSDPIKKMDLYTMYDPLTYPQLRLPREVLEKYNDYFKATGTYPPFGEATQPFLFDNPQMVGILIKHVDENEPFADNIPSSVPLFRVRSSKNANRYFYYIIDQRYLSKIEQKIPLAHVKVNGVRIPNANEYGLPELFDEDVIEDIPIFPFAKFKVTLYKTYSFP